MIPIRSLRLQLGKLLAADPTTLAPVADANLIALVMAPFISDEALVLADVTLANFVGSTPLEAGVGTQQDGTDPATDEQIVTLLEPAGGWRFVATALTNLPQDIHGYVLLNNAGDMLLASKLLDAPITLGRVGDQVQLGTVGFDFVQRPLS